jgi:hypothetical protein
MQIGQELVCVRAVSKLRQRGARDALVSFINKPL